MSQNWVHVIGVAGVTTSGVAVMFNRYGWKVTGSDKGFFPPVSDYLKDNGVEILPGFKPDRLTDETGQHPDVVVIQGTKGKENPELIEATKLKLNIKTYPEILEHYVIKKGRSIVIAGTYGKTTITAALVQMFAVSNRPISYMIGGISINTGFTVVPLREESMYSVVEGDEFITSLSDKRSKFFYYHPDFLILNAVSWEHPDVFTNEAEYIKNFKKLVRSIPPKGLVVANANDRNAVDVATESRARVIYYSINPDEAQASPHWYLNPASHSLPTFVRKPEDEDGVVIPYEKQIIGEFNEENLLAAAAMASELGVDSKSITEAIKDFRGIRRRLEIRYQSNKIIVIDDFGSSPPKAKGALAALRKDFPRAEITIVFEPSSGNRVATALALYDGVFTQADKLVFPRFTKLPKTSKDRFDGDELAVYLAKSGVQVSYIEDDANLVRQLIKIAKKKTKVLKIICFMGSHSFRGMINQLIEEIK